MAHVGVERLTTRDDQEDRTERQEGLQALVAEELDRVVRVDRLDDPRRIGDVPQAEHRDGGEPDHHHRPEDFADCAGPSPLHPEQTDEDDDRDRDDPALERRGHLFQALDRAEHRDRRGDDAVAVEQRGAEHTQRDEEPALATVRPRFGITSAVSAKIPPSPLLSARMTSIRYLIEMMMMSDQKANEHTP